MPQARGLKVSVGKWARGSVCEFVLESSFSKLMAGHGRYLKETKDVGNASIFKDLTAGFRLRYKQTYGDIRGAQDGL